MFDRYKYVLYGNFYGDTQIFDSMKEVDDAIREIVTRDGHESFEAHPFEVYQVKKFYEVKPELKTELNLIRDYEK